MPNPIIVALDPERGDDAPLLLGAWLARITGAPLMALAACFNDPITNAVTSPTVDAERRAHALARLEALTSGVDADLLVMGGASPARVLHDAAVELEARLIVVGSTAKGPLRRVAPGSTGERLMHGAPCPVAIATSGLGEDWEPRRVGVGFVDLDDGHGALRAAAALARAAGGTLRVTTAIEPLAWRRTAAITPYQADGQLAPSKVEAQRALDDAIAHLPAGTRATGEVVAAEPSAALVELSRHVDLLVCGSRGYGPLRAVLVGGVTHPVIRKAHCPVVVVPNGTDDALGASRHETERSGRT